MTDQPTYDPAANLRAYADALTANSDPDAPAWADALRWAVSRVHGGHTSLHAHRAFRQRFGTVAEHCGVGPRDGTENITDRTSHDQCAACRQPFDAADDRWNGRAQHGDTTWCRSCIDRCHDNESADHRCPVCR